MNRRTVLKNLLVSSGGMIALPAWANAWSIPGLPAGPSVFSDREQVLLASVADTIIPAGSAIGALAVGVDKFLQRLFSDCYEKEVQDNIKKQLAALDDAARQAYGKSFTDSSGEQRQTILLALPETGSPEAKSFFQLIKSETIRGFSTSKEVMQQYQGYKVAPGHYYGCVPVKN